MYQKHYLKVKKCRIINSLIAFITVFILTTSLAFLNMQTSQNKITKGEAQYFLNIFESMLSDSRSAVREASKWLDKGCTPQVEERLNILPASYMNIYSINISHKQRISCSSLLMNKNRNVKFIVSGLWMSHAINSQNIEVVTYKQTLPQGEVYVASDLRFLVNAMNRNDAAKRLVLDIAGKILTPDGLKERPFSTLDTEDYKKFPVKATTYTLMWKKLKPLEIFIALATSWLSICFIFTTSITIAGLVWLISTRRHSLYTELSNDIKCSKIQPWYQPLICASSGNVCGAEILARWNHNEIGMIPPDVFIPIAEKTQLIVTLTESLIEQVVNDIKHSRLNLPTNFKLNINISHYHFTDDSFHSFINIWGEYFKELGVTLVFEITEREDIHINENTMKTISIIKNNGIELALDDFGTGFSNLAFIATLNPNNIKIDRMFVRQISEGTSTPLIDCVIDMAKQMNIRTTAEGVEHNYQMNYLIDKKIDCLQGYLFSKPLPFKDFRTYFQQNSAQV